MRALDRPRDDVLEPAEDGAAPSGRLVGAKAVVRVDVVPAPGARLAVQRTDAEKVVQSKRARRRLSRQPSRTRPTATTWSRRSCVGRPAARWSSQSTADNSWARMLTAELRVQAPLEVFDPRGAAPATPTALHASDSQPGPSAVIVGPTEDGYLRDQGRRRRGRSAGVSGGLWLEQAHADQPPVAIDALDRVSVQLELTDDGCREVNPAGVQLGKGERLVAGLAQTGATGRVAAVVGDLDLAGGRRAVTRARGLDPLVAPRRWGGMATARISSAERGTRVMGSIASARISRFSICGLLGSQSRSMIPRRAGSVGDGPGRWRRVDRCPRPRTSPSRVLGPRTQTPAMGVHWNVNWPCGQDSWPEPGCHQRRDLRHEARGGGYWF